MSELAEFLLARTAEDEAAWSGGTNLVTRPDFAKLARHMLADCDAKRRIVEHCGTIVAEPTKHDRHTWKLAETVLFEMAQAYADHPDNPTRGVVTLDMQAFNRAVAEVFPDHRED